VRESRHSEPFLQSVREIATLCRAQHRETLYEIRLNDSGRFSHEGRALAGYAKHSATSVGGIWRTRNEALRYQLTDDL